MVRKSLLVAALLALAMPLSAQEDHIWTSRRPDGQAPLGIMNARTLELGEIKLSYQFSQFDSRGQWFEGDSIPVETTLEFYEVAPLTLSDKTHKLGVAYGATEDLSIAASMTYGQVERAHLTDAGVFYVTGSEGIGDLELDFMYTFFNEGPYRAHVQLGGLLPTGDEGPMAETPFSAPGEEALPYDMRMGAGTFALLPGATVQVQNDVASVGAQVKANISLGKNDLDYALGNSFEATVWAAYRLNDYFSVSGRLRWLSWNGIDGADPALDPLRDPGNDGFFQDGERFELPVGMNFYLPEGSRFAGHRLSIEGFFPISHDYEGPQFGMDWGVVMGWHVAF